MPGIVSIDPTSSYKSLLMIHWSKGPCIKGVFWRKVNRFSFGYENARYQLACFCYIYPPFIKCQAPREGSMFCLIPIDKQKFVKIWIWNVTNQMIVFSAFIQSEYRGTRHHFSILLVSFSVLKNKQIQVNDSWLLPSTTESLFLKYWTESILTTALRVGGKGVLLVLLMPKMGDKRSEVFSIKVFKTQH